jgi:hypothetical protein
MQTLPVSPHVTPNLHNLIQQSLAPFLQQIHPGAFSSERALHPSAFHLDQRLSDWPECWLELRCPCSPRTVLHPVKMLLQRGDRPFRSVLAALLLRLPGQAGAGLFGSRARPESHGRASAKLGRATGAWAALIHGQSRRSWSGADAGRSCRTTPPAGGRRRGVVRHPSPRRCRRDCAGAHRGARRRAAAAGTPCSQRPGRAARHDAAGPNVRPESRRRIAAGMPWVVVVVIASVHGWIARSGMAYCAGQH